MPARSQAQQKAAGAALSAKRGETPKSRLKGASRQMVDSMSEDQLEEFASTKRKRLPARKGAKSSRKATGSRKKSAPRKKTAARKKPARTSSR